MPVLGSEACVRSVSNDTIKRQEHPCNRYREPYDDADSDCTSISMGDAQPETCQDGYEEDDDQHRP